jgi:hypothetical protein
MRKLMFQGHDLVKVGWLVGRRNNLDPRRPDSRTLPVYISDVDGIQCVVPSYGHCSKLKVTFKLGVMTYFCNPSYSGGRGRRIKVPDQPGQKLVGPCLKNKLQAKGLGVRLKW